MSEETGVNSVDNNAVVEDSIIKEQSVTIATLTDQLSKTGSQAPQILYQPGEKVKSSGQPNIILIAVLGFIGWQFFKRR